MTVSEKYKFIFHLVPSGVEFAVFVRGSEKRHLMFGFINELLDADQGEMHSSPQSKVDHFVVNEIQLRAIQAFLNENAQ